MTYNKGGPYEAEALGDQYAVFGPTVPGRDEKDSQFYVGGVRKCASLSDALNLAYAAGVKEGVKAERERCAKIIDRWPTTEGGYAAVAEEIRQEPG